MPLYSAPTRFVADLRAYDPLLRVRWSDYWQEWRIERKITRGRWIDPSTYPEDHWDDYVAARDGYLCVLTCDQNQLDTRILQTLWASDVQRRGGAEVVDDGMRAHEAATFEAGREGFRDRVGEMAKDRYQWGNSLSPTKRHLTA